MWAYAMRQIEWNVIWTLKIVGEQDPKYNESTNTATLWNEAFNLSPSFGLCDPTAGDWVLYNTSD